MATIRTSQSATQDPQPSSMILRNSSADWERHREQICQLYPDHILKDVMKIMEEEHGFIATARAYKGHLVHWNQSKYLKLDEVNTELSRMARAADGDKSFKSQIRNRTVTLKQLERSKKRRRIRRNIHPTANGEAVPGTEDPTTYAQTTNICSSPKQPMVYLQPQQAFYWFHKYLTSTTWKSVSVWPYARPTSISASDDCRTAIIFSSLIDPYTNACSISSSGYLEGSSQAKRHLRKCLVSLDVVARIGSVSAAGCFLPVLLELVARVPEIARLVLRVLVNAYEKHQPRSHPIYLFFQQLSRVDPAALRGVLECSAQVNYDGLSDALGPSHGIVIVAHFDFVIHVLRRRGSGIEIAGWHRFLEAFADVNSDDSRWEYVYQSYLCLAWLLADTGEFSACKYVAEQAAAKSPSRLASCAQLFLIYCDFMLGKENEPDGCLALCLDRWEQVDDHDSLNWPPECEFLLENLEMEMRVAGYEKLAVRCQRGLARLENLVEIGRYEKDEVVSLAIKSLETTTGAVRPDDKWHSDEILAGADDPSLSTCLEIIE